MSLAIKTALEHLDRGIDRLESAARTAAAKPKLKPATGGKSAEPDLFSAPNVVGPNVVGSVTGTGAVVHFDRRALAKKLDATIARVEQLLGDGATRS